MKKLLLILLFISTTVFADAVIFSGDDVKTLKQNIDLNGVVKLLSGSLNPSTTPGGVAAPIGSAYLQDDGTFWLKKGSSNDLWTKAIIPDTNGMISGSFLQFFNTINFTGTVEFGDPATTVQTYDVRNRGAYVWLDDFANFGEVRLKMSPSMTNFSDYTWPLNNPTNGQHLVSDASGQWSWSSDIVGNAATVTTNHNLTGPITSIGNTTSVASQTGTGSKFVMDTSPTLVTPVLGTPASATLTNATGLPLSTGVTGILPVANGGTGSTTRNFIDLTSNETIAGTKTFSSTISGSVNGNAATVTTIPTLSGEVSNTGNAVTLSNASVIAKVLTSFSESAGVVASTDSILQAIQKLSGNELPVTSAVSASDIDWSTVKRSGGLYTKTLSGNTTFTFSNKTSGQNIIVRLTNTASNFTVTWPTVKWSGGTPPVQTVGAKSDVYTFVYDGTDIYGSVVQNF